MKVKTQTHSKRTKQPLSPFSEIVGQFYVSEELGHGQITTEIEPGLFKAECYINPSEPPCLTKYISVEQLPALTLCKDKAVWLSMLQGDEPCDCDYEEPDDEQCMCPDCTEERRINIERMEHNETSDAIERTGLDTIADSKPSAEAIAFCAAELAAARRNGYKHD